MIILRAVVIGQNEADELLDDVGLQLSEQASYIVLPGEEFVLEDYADFANINPLEVGVRSVQRVAEDCTRLRAGRCIVVEHECRN
jgi:hypothetical protein